MEKLSDRQSRFVEEYLVDLNAYQAAIRAGYSDNPNSGYRLLQNPKIRQCVEEQLGDCSQRAGVNGEQVLRELAQIAFANSADVVNLMDGTILEGASRDSFAAVASVKVKSNSVGFEREVKLLDKLRALELLGKCLGLFRERDSSEPGDSVIIREDFPE